MVCQFYLSSQRTSFWLCWFLLCLFCFFFFFFFNHQNGFISDTDNTRNNATSVSFAFISVLIFKISFLLLTLGFFISSFSSYCRCIVRLFIWLFSCFLRCAYTAMNLPLSTAFTVSHRFWVVVFSFSFISMHILISFFDFFCDLLVIQQHVVQPPYVGIFNSFSPCVLFVVFPLLLLIFVVCVWSVLIWLICVLGCFTLDLSCLGLSGFLGLGWLFPSAF